MDRENGTLICYSSTLLPPAPGVLTSFGGPIVKELEEAPLLTQFVMVVEKKKEIKSISTRTAPTRPS